MKYITSLLLALCLTGTAFSQHKKAASAGGTIYPTQGSLSSGDSFYFWDASGNSTTNLYFSNLKTTLWTDQILLGSLQIPNAAAPTVDVFGEVAGDNNLWAASHGAMIFYDGTAPVAVVATLVSDTPTNGQVPTWNTGGTITWETPSAGGGGLTSSDLAGATALAVNYAYYDTISATRTFDALPAGSNGDQITITFDVTGATRSVNFHTNSTVYRIGESGSLASALSFPVGNHKISLEKRDGKWFLLDSAPDSGPVEKTTGVNYTIGTTRNEELYGGVIYVTASVTITIPAILEKMSFSIIPIGAVTVTVTPQAGETLWLDGVTTAAGDSLESSGVAGALAAFTYKSAGAMHASTAAWTAP